MSDLLPWPLPIKLQTCDAGLSIWAYYEDRAPHKILDVRGWGHLTGAGACNLEADDAENIQNMIAKAVCDVWNTRNTAEIERLEAEKKRLVNAILAIKPLWDIDCEGELDNESVGWTDNKPMVTTFGEIRELQSALTQAGCEHE
jgi:hypothetical protein